MGVFSDTLVKATPLILTGLACTLAFRMKLWNIGAEGQFFMGAWGASAVVLVPLLPATTPRIIMLSAMMLARLCLRRAVGIGARLSQGQAQRQRDHHQPDDELYRHVVGVVLGVRRVERARLSDVAHVPRRPPGCRA